MNTAQNEKYRTEGGHLYEYSEQHQAYIHVYRNDRLKGQALINAYEQDLATGSDCDE